MSTSQQAGKRTLLAVTIRPELQATVQEMVEQCEKVSENVNIRAMLTL